MEGPAPRGAEHQPRPTQGQAGLAGGLGLRSQQDGSLPAHPAGSVGLSCDITFQGSPPPPGSRCPHLPASASCTPAHQAALEQQRLGLLAGGPLAGAPGAWEAEALLGPWHCARPSRPSTNIPGLHILCPWPRPLALWASGLWFVRCEESPSQARGPRSAPASVWVTRSSGL